MKKTLIIFSVLALAMGVSLSASAEFMHEADGPYDEIVNHDTGDNSYNKIELESDRSIKVENEDNAFIMIKAENKASTGDNDVNGNVGNVYLKTGSALALQQNDVKANLINTMIVDTCPCDGHEFTYANDDTGNGSTNKIEVEDEADIRVENDKNAFVGLDVENEAETGDNDVNGNGTVLTDRAAVVDLGFTYETMKKKSSKGLYRSSKFEGTSISGWLVGAIQSDEEVAGGDVVVETGNSQAEQATFVYTNEDNTTIVRGVGSL